ncbi:MAG: c-type cytochrome [Verrucomicrobia bacterium]|nr:c-type cytochrome [Verrucomicrobiota bacterium]
MRAVLLLAALFLTVHGGFSQTLSPDRVALAIEALTQLGKERVAGDPKLSALLQRALDATRGTPRFVDLVRRMEVSGQSEGLIETALNASDLSVGAEALRMVLDENGQDLLGSHLKSADSAALIRLVQALGNTGDQNAHALMEPIALDSSANLEVRRQVVRSMAQTRAGSSALLALARSDRLPNELKLVARGELHAARWPEIRAEAEQLLPAPKSSGAEPLPPIRELIERSGNPERGALVFEKPEVGCIRCHQVNGRGTDFGPKLSEIGTKLGKDALYEAILEPSAGISFDYEAWEVLLNNGEETLGLIVSETAEEITVKTQNGVLTRYPKDGIESRRKMSTSIMPSGLEQTMSVSDLTDLVEYLASLKAAKPPQP